MGVQAKIDIMKILLTFWVTIILYCAYGQTFDSIYYFYSLDSTFIPGKFDTRNNESGYVIQYERIKGSYYNPLLDRIIIRDSSNISPFAYQDTSWLFEGQVQFGEKTGFWEYYCNPANPFQPRRSQTRPYCKIGYYKDSTVVYEIFPSIITNYSLDSAIITGRVEQKWPRTYDWINFKCLNKEKCTIWYGDTTNIIEKFNYQYLEYQQSKIELGYYEKEISAFKNR